MTVLINGNAAADEALIATLHARLPGCIDLITQVNAFNSWFFKGGRRIPLPGSHTMLFEVENQESGDITWFDGLDPLGMNYTPGKTMLNYGHAFGSIPVPLNLTEKLRNRDGVVHDIPTQRYNHVLKTLQNRLAAVTLSGTGGKQPLGFLNMIEAAAVGSQSANVGGVDKSTQFWFNNQYEEIPTADKFGTVVSTGMVAGIHYLYKLILKCRRGAFFPDAVFVNSSIMTNVLRAQSALLGVRTMDGVPDSTKVGIGRNASILGVPIIEEVTLPADTALVITSSVTTVPFGGVAGGTEDPKMTLTPDDIGGAMIGYHRELDMVVTPPRQIAGNVMGDVFFTLFSQTNVITNMLAQGRLGAETAGGLDNWS